MNKMKVLARLAALAALLVAAACSSSSDGNPDGPEAPDSAEPVTLTVMHYGGVTNEMFQEQFAIPAKEKFPHVTLQYNRLELPNQNADTVMNALDQMIVANQIPDIYLGGYIPYFLPRNLVLDLNPLIRQFNVDMGRIQDGIGNISDQQSPHGETWRLPLDRDSAVMVYNKTLFDRFGVDYPRDLMNYDEYMDLVRLMTRTDNGIPYRGGVLDIVPRVAAQLNLLPVDTTTWKSRLLEPEFIDFANFWKAFHEIPGVREGRAGANGFMVDQTLAMWPRIVTMNAINELHKTEQETELEWDMVTYPTFAQAPGVNTAATGSGIMMSPQGAHQEQAFQLLTYWAFDKEFVTQRSRNGVITALRDPDIQAQFAADAGPAVEGKNIGAMFLLEKSGYRQAPLYGSEAWTILVRQGTTPIVEQDTNVVVQLRIADEALNQLIQADMEQAGVK